MKKLIYCTAVLALAFFAGSCQREGLEPVAGNDTVTYTVEVPGAVATKAGVTADGVNNVNELVYEVYRILDEENLVLAEEALYHETVEVANGKAKFEVEYINDQNYLVLFWAHQAGNDLYNVSDLRNVTVNSSASGNTHASAAFTGTDILRNGISDKFGSVSLTRPVAQLNLATSNESLSLKGKVITVEESEITVSGLYASFDVATQEVSDEIEVTYSSASAALGNLNDSYKLVSMNYVGFIPASGATVDVDYTLTTSEGTITDEIAFVPVKRNIRTNIIGNLISNNSDYDVELDPDWGGAEENIVVVSDATSLQNAIDNAAEGDVIKLDGDIDLNDLSNLLTKAAANSSLNIPNGKVLTLDLNSYNLSAVDESTGSYGLINNAGTLTIKNSAVTVSTISLEAKNERNTNNYSSVISNQPGGNLTVLSNVTIEHLGGTYMAYGIDNLTNGKGTSAVTVIDGATIKSTYRAVRQFLNGESATNELTVKAGSVLEALNKGIFFQDPSKKANTGKLVVEDGADVGSVYLFVCDGSTEWPVNVSIAASAVVENGVTWKNVPAGYVVENIDGVWTVSFKPVAKIGDKGYWSLNAAVAAVQDGETITLVADEIFTENNRTYNSGTWYDGLYYVGDKSFTIDLGGKTISQDGAVNDYLLNFKNDGAKANVITLKNGTVDAGTAAFCALCTSAASTQNLTINLEGVNLINNISNGSTLKIRGDKIVLNVKSGTKITGKDSYLGIECVAATVNIYEGAEIYMNGTSSYLGCLVGACCNGVVNVYGGYGKGVKGGFVAMTSGGTINVEGGEWIANTDGSVGDNSNVYVLTAQNNKNESGYAGASIINVTGGTFRGGMDAWILTDANVEKAELNISGGNFNIDPLSHLVEGYKAVENNGVWNVVVNPHEVSTFAELKAAVKEGKKVVLSNDIVMEEVVALNNQDFYLDGNGYTIRQAGNCTNSYALFDIIGGNAAIKNVTFDGIMGGAIVRTVDTEFVADNVTAKNGNHTQIQGIFRLLGKSTVSNCTFEGNNCNMVLTLNFDADENEYYQVVEGCVFQNNTCNDTAVAYYVCGTGSTFNGNKFIGNKVSSKGNAATLYMGFTKNHTITNNVFQDNDVTTTHASTKRATGGLMIGHSATISANSFTGNTVTAVGRKLGNDVCASVYYADIDLSGNYWGGSAPVENDDYFVEYPDNNKVIINDFLTTYGN